MEAEITQYIQNVLQRDPHPGEVDAWQAVIDSGSSLEDVRGLIIDSSEAVNDVYPVILAYQAIYGRVPDAAGLHYWTGVYEANLGLDNPATTTVNEAMVAVLHAFVDPDQTPEFVTRYGADPTGDQFVAAAYQNVLGRTPDQAGLNYWQGRYAQIEASYADSGMSEHDIDVAVRSQILEQFVNSAEFEHLTSSDVDAYLAALAEGETPTGSLMDQDSSGTDGSTTALTPAIDIVDGTAGNDLIIGTFHGTTTSTTTLQGGDVIDGGAGNDTLRVVSDAPSGTAITPTMSNVENLELNQFASNVYSLTNTSGVQNITLANGNNTATVQGVDHLVDIAAANTTAGGLTITYDGAVTAGTADVQNINLNNASTTLNMTGSTAINVNGIETFNVTATGSNNVSLSGNSSLSTINVSGDGDLTVTNVLAASVTTFDASAATGDVSAIFAAGGNVTATGGTGDDSFDFGSGLTKADTVNGGDGYDTVRTSTTGDLSAAASVAHLNALTSIEHVVFDGGSGVTLNGSTFTNADVTNIQFNTTNADVFNNADSAHTYEFGVANGGTASFALAGSATTLDLASMGTAGTLAANDGTDADVGHVSIVTAGAGSTTTPVTVNWTSNGDLADGVLTGSSYDQAHFNDVNGITAASGSTFHFSGDGNLAIFGGASTSVTAGFTNGATIDLSALTANTVIAGSDAQAGAGATLASDASNNTVAANAGVDNITLAAGNHDLIVFDNANASGVIEYAKVGGTDGTATGNILHDTITGFEAGANGDMLFQGADLANAVANDDYTAVSASIQGSIDALSGAGATLQAAADMANGQLTTTAGWTAFDFQGSAYALYNADGASTFTDGDTLVQLVGVHAADLVDANFAA